MFGFVMIFIAIGSNLPHPEFGPPVDVCNAAIDAIEAGGCRILAKSRWYRSTPVPASNQPDFVNGVVSVQTGLEPAALLSSLHAIEARFDRVRSVPNAARTLDLDLIAYGDMVNDGQEAPFLPHPRMAGRGFVLLPLRDVAPAWKHPVLGDTLATLIAALPGDQICTPID
ncbi:MAG: 2-amino-4-hydroxy-6-hydroxymethyldihydropteridine diphosphokinase [Paracoccaceae bacterium]|jgi:2-amino-4-hydroxy-6-hydroxymethyldihydropteridine diphosphokinase